MNRYDQKMQELNSEFRGAHMGHFPFAVTEEDIESVEGILQETLPADFREFVRDYGNYVQSAAFVFDENPYGIQIGGVGHFWGIVAKRYEELKRTCALTDVVESYDGLRGEEDWPQHWLPIAGGDGSDFYVMEFKGQNKGAIHYITDASLSERFKIADSFDEFLQHIRVNTDDEVPYF